VPRNFRVGLTGGIASGKTTIANLFAALGVPIVDTDVLAREVLEPGAPLLAEVIEHFGTGIVGADGALDRRALRARVFADPAERRWLEARTHPAIRARTDALSDAAPGPYVMVVIPLLVETGGADRFDRVLVVDVDPAVQLARLQARHGSSRAEAERIVAAQATRAARLAVAHDVIRNDGDLASLRDQVAALHRRYVEAARLSSGRQSERAAT
jgi:dephospho-CoA kinase